MPRKKVEKVDETMSIALALKELCEEKGLPTSVVVDAMSESLKKAYFKFSDDYPDTVIKVDIDLATGKIQMFKVKNVVEEIQDDVFETDPEEAFEEYGVHYNVGDIIETPIDISTFRRAAAMQAKSVFKQKLREAEKQVIADRYQNKVGYILTGTVDAVDEKHCIVKLGGHTNAYLNKNNVIPGENLKLGQIIKVYVEDVDKNATGSAPIIVSRTNPKFVTRLMEEEIPDIQDGSVEIKGVARQPGLRSKVAVCSKDPNVDPSGACIGPRGARISRVLVQLNNEKIDIVNYDENPLLYVADALKPAIVIGGYFLDEENKAIRVIVGDDQFSLAIGRDAINVNLAVRLTGYKIDIRSLSDATEAGLEYQLIDDLKLAENAKKARSYKSTVSSYINDDSEYIPEFSDDEEEIEDVDSMISETYENEIKHEEAKVEKASEKVNEKPAEKAVEKAPEKPAVEDKPIVRPTRSKTPNMFSELEAALNATNTPEETKPTKKKVRKNRDEDDEMDDTLPVETKKSTPVMPSNALPVYTEEELRAMEEEEEAEEASKYDDEVDYDEFDEYYDDEDR